MISESIASVLFLICETLLFAWFGSAQCSVWTVLRLDLCLVAVRNIHGWILA